MFFKHLVFVITVLSFVHSTPSCGENEVYTNCMSPCKLQQCKHLKQTPDCDRNIKCQPGCECIEHFLRNSDNVCISSKICEEYDSKFDPETDIDVILNESDDDEATNEDNIVSSQDGITKETEPGSESRSNTEDVENKDHDNDDDDLDINGIVDYQSFNNELKNGDWVIEETERNDINQEPNTDQKVSSQEEIKNVDNSENIEQNKQLSDKEREVDADISTEKQNVPTEEKKVEPATATTITPKISQGKISATELKKFSYEVITTEKSSVDLDLLSVTEKKLKPEEIESNGTEPNQINIDDNDNIGNTKVDQNVDETLETSTMPEENELPIRRPVTEIYPKDKKDSESEYDQNSGETKDTSNMPENKRWPNKRPDTDVYPEDKKDTNQWREPPSPWDDEQPYTTSRPEKSTRPWSPYIPSRRRNGSNRHKRPRSRKDPITVIYPIFIKDNSNERHIYPDTRPKNRHENKPCSSCNTRSNYEREYEHQRNREHGHDRKRGHERNRNHEYERNRDHGHDRDHGHERNRYHEYERNRNHDREREHEQERNREHGNERNRNHDRDRERENEQNREHGHDRDRENEWNREHGHDRERENDRNREHGHDRDREPERRRGYEREDKDYDRPSHRKPRTWCRRYPGDRRRPCPWYNRSKHDSRPDYENKEHNSKYDRSYKRPKRVCRYQRYGKPICYVPKSYKRDSRRN